MGQKVKRREIHPGHIKQPRMFEERRKDSTYKRNSFGNYVSKQKETGNIIFQIQHSFPALMSTQLHVHGESTAE